LRSKFFIFRKSLSLFVKFIYLIIGIGLLLAGVILAVPGIPGPGILIIALSAPFFAKASPKLHKIIFDNRFVRKTKNWITEKEFYKDLKKKNLLKEIKNSVIAISILFLISIILFIFFLRI